MNTGPRPSLLECARVQRRPNSSNAGPPAKYSVSSSNIFLPPTTCPNLPEASMATSGQSPAPSPAIAAAIADPTASRASATGEPTERTYLSAIAVDL